MTRFIIYRNGPPTLADRITAALAHYSREHGAKPAALIVHPASMDAALEAVKALGVELPVVCNGGVASVECWLKVK